MAYFDSHAHLSSPEMLPEIDGIMQRAKLNQVTRILNICTDPLSLKEGLELEKKFSAIQNAGATPPHDVEKEGEEAFVIFEKAARSNQLVAIGETGLEYHHKRLDRVLQKEFLIRYLHLAKDTKLPVIFHCREAFHDLFAITDAEYPKELPAVLHCFTGTIAEAEEVLSRGWYLSLSGIVTFKKSIYLREIAKIVPLKQLLIETDAPYLAPQSKRGKLNEPSYIIETAQMIAECNGITEKEVALTTFANASNLFGKRTAPSRKGEDFES